VTVVVTFTEIPKSQAFLLDVNSDYSERTDLEVIEIAALQFLKLTSYRLYIFLLRLFRLSFYLCIYLLCHPREKEHRKSSQIYRCSLIRRYDDEERRENERL